MHRRRAAGGRARGARRPGWLGWWARDRALQLLRRQVGGKQALARPVRPQRQLRRREGVVMKAHLPRLARASRALRGLALLAASCGCAGESPPRAPAIVPPTGVQTSKADRSLRPVLTEVVGTVRSVHVAATAPLVSGVVTEVPVGVGGVVRAGEVLVRFSAV